MLGQRRIGHDAKGDGDDFRRKNEVGADRALDLVLFERHQIDRRIRHRLDQFGMFGLVFSLAVEEFMGELFKPLETQVSATQHQ
ncbi:hypothetical protein D3C73_1567500 [compost metagenome]